MLVKHFIHERVLFVVDERKNLKKVPAYVFPVASSSNTVEYSSHPSRYVSVRSSVTLFGIASVIIYSLSWLDGRVVGGGWSRSSDRIKSNRAAGDTGMIEVRDFDASASIISSPPREIPHSRVNNLDFLSEKVF